MSDWIDETRRFYQAHPAVSEMLAAGAPITTPINVLERRWRVRYLIREQARSASTAEDRRSVLRNTAMAVLDGDLTKQEAKRIAGWFEKRA